MTADLEVLKKDFASKGYFLPEWLLIQKPQLVVMESGVYFVVDGGVYFEAEQFSRENVIQRYELIWRVSN